MSDFDRLLGDSLKGVRDAHIRQIEAEVPAARRRIEEGMRGRRTRFVVGGVAVAAAALAAIVFVTQTLPRIDRSAPIRPSGEPVVLARIDVPGVGVMESGIGKLWVSHQERLFGIDPKSSSVEVEIVTGRSEGVDDLATDSEALFAISATDRTLSRLPYGTDESAGSVDMEGTPTVVAASEEAVWVAAAVGPVGDSQILTYTPHLEMPGDSVVQLDQRVVADMTHAGGALWMTVSEGPESAYEVRRFFDDGGDSTWELSEDQGNPAEIVLGEGAAWILRQPTRTGGNTITRIDLETDEVTERALSFDDPIESIAVGEGYLWVTTAPLRMNATLHRIDPTTLQEAGEPLDLSEPGSKLAAGNGYVWVGDPNNNQIVQIDPSGQASPEPSPAPEETEPPANPEASCSEVLPFEPGYRAQTWSIGVGSGGQIGVPLEEQAPQAVVHYLAEPGRFVDVIDTTTAEPPFPVEDEEPIEVLGGPGTLSPIEDGFAIVFGYQECSYQLLAYGFDRDETRWFAEGLVLRGKAGLQTDAFALWPESTPEEAHQGCLLAWDGSFRRDARDTAQAFAVERLGWIRAVSVAGEVAEGEFTSVEVWRQGSPSMRLTIGVREVAADCWSVISVRTVNPEVPDDTPTGLSVSSVDGRTRVSFDLEREAAGRAVDSVRLIVGPGQVLLSADEFVRKGFIELTDAPVDAPTYVLVLLFDEERDVMGAIGQALPSGDFSGG